MAYDIRQNVVASSDDAPVLLDDPGSPITFKVTETHNGESKNVDVVTTEQDRSLPEGDSSGSGPSGGMEESLKTSQQKRGEHNRVEG